MPVSYDNALEILKAGIRAPSADNLQPWKFVLHSSGNAGEYVSRIDLYLEKSRTHDFAASGLLMLYVSAGAVIENIRIAALYHGANTEVQYFPVASDSLYVAALVFQDASPYLHAHYPAIMERVTNRKFYSSRAINPEVYSRLAHLAGDEGCRLIRIKKGEDKYKELESLLEEADQLRYEVERLHREFVKILRFGHDPGVLEDGLPIPALEAGPGADLVFKMISSWDRMKFLNKLGFSRLMGFYTKLQMRSSQAGLLLTSDSQKAGDYVRGGEVMQKIWHEATVQGFAMQPMEALPIFILNMELKITKDFSRMQMQTLQILKEKFQSVFNLRDSQGLIMLWRIGHAPKVSARSYRRPVESFLVKS